ncbi:hypothetical protein DW2_00720 [Thioclava atlantica]|uniref:Uncharacterized protein n=2 Tax=Thioclava atlantica TaxID=1317124 RepID=A0A085U0Y9_9RHOB|nr:hypothetical protein DW2_00720 [Thioclava atlantica]
MAGAAPGKAQIAAELQTFPELRGINPADYSTAELTDMLDAAQSGHMTTALYYADHADLHAGGPGIGTTNQGKSQLAAELRNFPQLPTINPGDYTVAELTNMLDAAQRGDLVSANYYARHQDIGSGGPGIGMTDQGKTQLAAQLGLNPDLYTVAQLQQIQHDLRRGHVEQAKNVVAQGNAVTSG